MIGDVIRARRWARSQYGIVDNGCAEPRVNALEALHLLGGSTDRVRVDSVALLVRGCRERGRFLRLAGVVR